MSDLSANQKDLLDRVIRKPELQPFFFGKVKGLKWFEELYKNGFFSPEKNPIPVPAEEEGYTHVPFWPAIQYLVATSSVLDNPQNEKYALRFLKIIRDCTNYAMNKNFGNCHTWQQFARIIQYIPCRLITLCDMKLIGYWLNDPFERGHVAEELAKNWFPKLLQEGDSHCFELAIKLLENIYVVSIKDHKYGPYEKKKAMLTIENWHAKKITALVAKDSGRRIGRPAVEFFYRLLTNYLAQMKNDLWSSIWRSAIEDHEQNRSNVDTGDILIQAFRDSLLKYVETNQEKTVQYIGSLLDSDYQTIKRIAVYIISQNYTTFIPLIDKILDEKYFLGNFQHELWHLLNKHYVKFNKEQKKIVINIINNLKIKDDNGNLNEKASGYKKAIWLSSIMEFDDDLRKQYQEYVQIAGSEPEHPDFSSYGSAGFVSHKSPFTLDELRTFKIDQLITELKDFKDSDRFDEPNLEGFAKCFKDLIKTEPLKIYKDLEKFLNCDLAFIYEIIEAYRELWNEKKKDIPWDDVWKALLDFSKQLAYWEQFWSEENSKQRKSLVANRHWIVGSIGHLIEDGVKTDEHAFNESLNEIANQILLLLLEKQQGEKFEANKDAVSTAISSPRGRCIEALVNLSLRSCRLADKSNKNHQEAWMEFEPIFEAELKLGDKGIYEFSTLVAYFLPNFLYMSQDWVKRNLDLIFNKKNYQQWLCSIQGYSYVSTIYKEIYMHLKSNNHFKRALDDKNIKESVVEVIVNNIVVAYINDFENLNDQDSLVSILINRCNYDEMRQLIWLIWRLRKDDDQKLGIKVFELWPRIISVIDFEKKEGKKLASQLCLWSVFIEKIDNDNKSLLCATAPYAYEDYNSYEFVRNLTRLSDNQPFEVHDIWMKMLEGCTPDHPKEAIEKYLGNLVAKGNEGIRKAKEASDVYVRRGNDNLAQYLHKLIEHVSD